MKTKFLILVIVCSIIQVTQLFSQIRSGDNVVIDETISHDLYIAGGTVTINAPVHGDLIIAGGTIFVNDTITQDILIAGGNITLNGYVGDDIRCAGGSVRLSSLVSGDFVVTGGDIIVDRKSTISGDLLSGGGNVRIDGIVKGSLKDASGNFTLNGKVERDVECKGGKIIINGDVAGTSILSGNTIELGTNAHFNNDVRYWNKNGSLNFNNSLGGYKATFDPSLKIENGKWHYLGFASFLMVLWYLGTALVMILLIQYLFSLTLKNAANTIKNTSLKSLGLGFLFLIAVPVSIMILFVTVIAIPVGVLLFISYLTIILLATVIVALIISNWINNTYYESAWGNGRIVIAAFGIFIFLKLASLTPVIGPLLMLIVACIAFGGILQNVKWKRNKALALT